MKLYLEDDNGQKLEVTQIQELPIGTDIIILKSDKLWYIEDVEEAERYYTRKFKKKVVIVDAAFSEILGIAKGTTEEEI